MLSALHDNVIVKPEESSKTSSGGLALISDDKNPTVGRVVSVGPLAEGVFLDTAVIFGDYAGTSVEDPDWGTVFIMNKKDILAQVVSN